MLRLIHLRLKECASWSLLFLFLLACQLFLTHMSITAAQPRAAALRLAILDLDKSEASSAFIESLNAVKGLELAAVGDYNEGRATLSSRQAEGLVTIPHGFMSVIEGSGRKVVEYEPAIGSSSASLVFEHLSAAILRIRAGFLFDEALAGINKDTSQTAIHVTEILSVNYEGPAVPDPVNPTPPAYGIAAVFVLPSALMAAFQLTGKDSLRVRTYGKSAFFRGMISGFIALLLCWSVLCALYLLLSRLLWGYRAGVMEATAFLCLVFYNLCLGWLAASLTQNRRIWAYAFPVYLLFNLTLGGALWNIATPHRPLWLFAPVALFSAAARGETTGHWILLTAGVGAGLTSVYLVCDEFFAAPH